jgi:hypothetical protein
MRPPRVRFTVRAMMVVVAVVAVTLTVATLVPRAVDPLLSDRAGTPSAAWVGRGGTRYVAVLALLTVMATSPFAIAILLALKPPPGDQTRRRKTVRWLGVAIALGCGLAVLDYPLNGMRTAWLLRDGSGVCFYHQYRLWPGEHITPCLELVSPSGRSRSYPIARNTPYPWWGPALRTNAEQTVVWFIDPPDARVRHGGVWCSLDRRTGAFAGAGGPHPSGVSETTGFPPSR